MSDFGSQLVEVRFGCLAVLGTFGLGGCADLMFWCERSGWLCKVDFW